MDDYMDQVSALCEHAHTQQDRRAAIVALTTALTHGMACVVVLGYPAEKHELILNAMTAALRTRITMLLADLEQRAAEECDDPDCPVHGKSKGTGTDLMDMPVGGNA